MDPQYPGQRLLVAKNLRIGHLRLEPAQFGLHVSQVHRCAQYLLPNGVVGIQDRFLGQIADTSLLMAVDETTI